MLKARMSEAKIAAAVSLPNVRVVDDPSLPVSPSSPRVGLNLLFGAVGGLFLGLGLAMLRDQVDPGMRGRAEVERETGLNVLTMVPHVDRPGPVVPLRENGILKAKSGSRALSERTLELLALEAYRGLASELHLAARLLDKGQKFRSLAVTSASRGEGKTLTACNLALVYASKGHRTLLVDADMRAGGVSRFFALERSEPGLSDLLTGRIPWLDSGVVRVSLDNGERLAILPAGRPTSEDAALLEGQTFRQLLGNALERYEYVIFDTPPLNLITDAAAVAAAVDGLLVVVRSGVTENDQLEYTLRGREEVAADLRLRTDGHCGRSPPGHKQVADARFLRGRHKLVPPAVKPCSRDAGSRRTPLFCPASRYCWMSLIPEDLLRHFRTLRESRRLRHAVCPYHLQKPRSRRTHWRFPSYPARALIYPDGHP